MGSEQSNQQNGQRVQQVAASAEPKRSSSPRPSICSDTDVPYVSYTVNRPIGDSPKLKSKSPHHGLRSATPSPRPSPSKGPRPRSSSGHDIVVVKVGAPEEETVEGDPEMYRLQRIPTFLPIMRGALNIPTVRDPDVLDKLDHKVVLDLCARYQDHLRQTAETVSFEQNYLTTRVREIDFAITTLMSMLTERQKKFAKFAEKLGKIQEVSMTLQKCQMNLVETLESLESLNALLPAEERLEPFVWTTG